MKTEEENPEGLHQKYNISRYDGKPIPEGDEFFVLKIAGKGQSKHRDACITALETYILHIEDSAPQLAKDLQEYINNHEWFEDQEEYQCDTCGVYYDIDESSADDPYSFCSCCCERSE